MSHAAPVESWRNVAILSAAQALAASAGPFVTSSGGIVGQSLAPSPLLATLPVTALVVGVACGTVPTSMLVRRIGRRLAFMTGAGTSAAAALAAAWATNAEHFVAFCAATFLMGVAAACVLQYRFAAAESVDARHVGRAVSFVLVGGIVAGALGPEIGRRGQDWFANEFSGPFVVFALIQVVAAALLTALRLPAAAAPDPHHDRLPASTFFGRPSFLLAVVGAGSAAAIMSFLMTATPISMHVHDAHSIEDAAFVIQSHVIAMYAPSLVTGWLVDRLGVSRMMTAGTLVLGASVAAGASGHLMSSYWTGLVLLGLGWNLLFIGATVLLAQSLAPAERFRAQGLNDLVVFSSMAIASLGSGAMLHRFGWVVMNLVAVPVLIAVLVLIARRKTKSHED